MSIHFICAITQLKINIFSNTKIKMQWNLILIPGIPGNDMDIAIVLDKHILLK